ncbi:MAG: amidohydrolase, partial [Pseudomonadota bacterium]
MQSILHAVTAALLAVFATPAWADTLIDNVEGITIDEDGALKRFTGLVFDDDGVITQTLERGEPRPQTDFGVDGEGRVMLPGMIDAHVHIMDLGFGALTLDL